MKVVDISTEIFRELGQPTDTSIAGISFGIRSSIGDLNSMIGTSYEIDLIDYEIKDAGVEISLISASVLKRIYLLKYYNKKITESLNSASVDSYLEVTSDGATVRKINRNEVAKTYIILRKDLELELKGLVNSIAFNGTTAAQVVGTDAIEWQYEPNEYLSRLI